MRNRFKGLDLIDWVPDELWTVVHDIVQETVVKTIPMEKKCNARKCSNYQTIALISHTSKVMLKILQARLQQYVWTMNFQMFKLDLEKAEKPEIKLPTSVQSLKMQENSPKTSTSALLTTPKPLTMWITTNCGKFFKKWEYQTTLPASWEICRQVKSNS